MSHALAQQVPTGYRENAKGHLVPETIIPEVDLLIDQFVNETATQWMQLHADLTTFKRKASVEVQTLVDLINDKYGAKRGRGKGNVQFYTYCGRFKLVIAVSETVVPGPEMQAAQEKILDCLDGWTKEASPELRAIVQEAFATDAQGSLRISRILAIKRYKIVSDDWQQAMLALDAALRVVSTKQYMRLYVRNSAGGYDPVPLDIAAL